MIPVSDPRMGLNPSIFNGLDTPYLAYPDRAVVNDGLPAYAKLEVMIAYLTAHNSLNYDAMEDFFLTYRMFASPITVWELLTSRLLWAADISARTGSESDLGRDVGTRCFVSLRYWITTYFEEDFVSDYGLRIIVADSLTALSGCTEFVLLKHFKRILDRLRLVWDSKLIVYWNIPAEVVGNVDCPVPVGGDEIVLEKPKKVSNILFGEIPIDADVSVSSIRISGQQKPRPRLSRIFNFNTHETAKKDVVLHDKVDFLAVSMLNEFYSKSQEFPADITGEGCVSKGSSEEDNQLGSPSSGDHLDIFPELNQELTTIERQQSFENSDSDTEVEMDNNTESIENIKPTDALAGAGEEENVANLPIPPEHTGMNVMHTSTSVGTMIGTITSIRDSQFEEGHGEVHTYQVPELLTPVKQSVRPLQSHHSSTISEDYSQDLSESNIGESLHLDEENFADADNEREPHSDDERMFLRNHGIIQRINVIDNNSSTEGSVYEESLVAQDTDVISLEAEERLQRQMVGFYFEDSVESSTRRHSNISSNEDQIDPLDPDYYNNIKGSSTAIEHLNELHIQEPEGAEEFQHLEVPSHEQMPFPEYVDVSQGMNHFNDFTEDFSQATFPEYPNSISNELQYSSPNIYHDEYLHPSSETPVEDYAETKPNLEISVTGIHVENVVHGTNDYNVVPVYENWNTLNLNNFDRVSYSGSSLTSVSRASCPASCYSFHSPDYRYSNDIANEYRASLDGDRPSISLLSEIENSMLRPCVGYTEEDAERLKAIPDNAIRGDAILATLQMLEGREYVDNESFNSGILETRKTVPRIIRSNTEDLYAAALTTQSRKSSEVDRNEMPQSIHTQQFEGVLPENTIDSIPGLQVSGIRRSPAQLNVNKLKSRFSTSTLRQKHPDGTPTIQFDLPTIHVALPDCTHAPFILSYTAYEVAEQMTIIANEIVNCVNSQELVAMKEIPQPSRLHSWLAIISQLPRPSSIELCILRSQLVSNWVQSEIMLCPTPAMQAQTVCKFIRISFECLRLQNFASMSEIMSAIYTLKSDKALRKDVFDLLPHEENNLCERFLRLISPNNNYAALRNMHGGVSLLRGSVPTIGLFLKDLALASEARSLNSETEIHFDKYRVAAKVVKSLQRLISSGSNYNLQTKQSLLSKCLYLTMLPIDQSAQFVQQTQAV